MTTRAHVALVVIAAAVIVFIIRLVRHRQLRAKYSVLWISIGVALGILAAWPALLEESAHAVGIKTPAFAAILAAISFLLVMCLHFSFELSRLEDRTRLLAEEAALLREQLDEPGRRASRGPAGG